LVRRTLRHIEELASGMRGQNEPCRRGGKEVYYDWDNRFRLGGRGRGGRSVDMLFNGAEIAKILRFKEDKMDLWG
jgi:hypothetical protein